MDSINMCLALFNFGGGEIILILAIVLLLFGAKKLPELAKGLGRGIKEFKKASTDEIHSASAEHDLPQPTRSIEPPAPKPAPRPSPPE